MPSVNLGRVSIVPKGAWSNSNSYEKLDVVTYGGGSYIANKDVPAGTSLTTTEYWSNFVGSFNIGTVETVSASTGASAELITTSTGQTLNLSIPRGVAGNESIDDTKGEGDTDYVWSADKLWNEVNNLDIDINGKANAIEKTISGDIVSFYDGADNQYVKSLKVNIEPQQDLHGYDNPWPAGGGKNKFNIEAVSNKTSSDGDPRITNNHNGTLTITLPSSSSNIATTETLGALANLTVGETYTLTFTTTGSATYINLVGASETWSSGSNKTITQEMLNGKISFYASGSGTTATISNIMIRPATVTDATYAPYANICPISGWTEANVWDDPKYGGTVAWNQLIENGNFDGTTRWGRNYGTITASNNECKYVVTTFGTWNGNRITQSSINIIQGHKYFVSMSVKLPYVVEFGVQAYASSTTIDGIKLGDGIANSYVTGNRIISATRSGLSEVRFYVSTYENKAINDEYYFKNAMLIDLTQMFGSTIADYIYSLEQAEAGAGVAWFKKLFPKDYYDYDNSYTPTYVSAVNGDPYRHITIPLGQTVYGGTLDVGTGTLRVTHAMVNLGSLTWKNSQYSDENKKIQYFDSLSPAPKAPTGSSQYADIIAEYYKTIAQTAFLTDINAILIGTNGYLWCITQADANPTGNAVYKLATPITITLTPQQLSTLLGENHIWADSGDIEVIYPVETKDYIDEATIWGNINGDISDQEDLQNEFNNIFIQGSYNSIFEPGAIDTSNGVEYAQSNRLRTQKFDKNVKKIIAETGYLILITAYSGNTYVGAWNGNSFIINSSNYFSDFVVDTSLNYDYRITLKRNDEQDIDISEASHVIFKTFTDKTLTLSSKAADAKITGNKLTEITNTLDLAFSSISLNNQIDIYRITNISNLTAGKAINSSGTVINQNKSYCTEYYIEIPNSNLYISSSIKLTTPASYYQYINFYDANKNYISDSRQGGQGISDIEIIPPLEAKYCRWTLSYVEIGNISSCNFEIFYPMAKPISSPKTKWYVLGDSISSGYFSITDAEAIEKGYDIAYRPAGLSGVGAVWDKTLEHNYWGYANKWFLHRTLVSGGYPAQGYLNISANNENGILKIKNTDFSDAGLITVAWGFNDWHYNKIRGDHNLINSSILYPEANYDITQLTTVNHAIWYCLGELIRKAPNAKIVVQTPMNGWLYGGDFSTNWGIGTEKSNSGTLAQIHDDIEYWANYYGLQILEMTYNNSIINRRNIQEVLLDGSHPTDIAHQQLGRHVSTQIGYY